MFFSPSGLIGGIVGGIIGAILLLIIVVVVILVLVFVTKKNKKSGSGTDSYTARKTYPSSTTANLYKNDSRSPLHIHSDSRTSFNSSTANLLSVSNGHYVDSQVSFRPAATTFDVGGSGSPSSPISPPPSYSQTNNGYVPPSAPLRTAPNRPPPRRAAPVIPTAAVASPTSSGPLKPVLKQPPPPKPTVSAKPAPYLPPAMASTTTPAPLKPVKPVFKQTPPPKPTVSAKPAPYVPAAVASPTSPTPLKPVKPVLKQPPPPKPKVSAKPAPYVPPNTAKLYPPLKPVSTDPAPKPTFKPKPAPPPSKPAVQERRPPPPKPLKPQVQHPVEQGRPAPGECCITVYCYYACTHRISTRRPDSIPYSILWLLSTKQVRSATVLFCNRSLKVMVLEDECLKHYSECYVQGLTLDLYVGVILQLPNRQLLPEPLNLSLLQPPNRPGVLCPTNSH